jgi:hypothetical protein
VSGLPLSCRWWRYPVKPLPARTLDHTKLRGKNRAVYPVRQFTDCAAYVCEPAKEGNRDRLQAKRDERPFRRQTKRPRRDEGCKLVLPGTWTFHGADKPYNERWTFTPAPKRRIKKAAIRLKPISPRLHNLPAWRGREMRYIQGKKRNCWVYGPAQVQWKPAPYKHFGAWEQVRYVPRTRLPRPVMTNMRHFLSQKAFL